MGSYGNILHGSGKEWDSGNRFPAISTERVHARCKGRCNWRWVDVLLSALIATSSSSNLISAHEIHYLTRVSSFLREETVVHTVSNCRHSTMPTHTLPKTLQRGRQPGDDRLPSCSVLVSDRYRPAVKALAARTFELEVFRR